MPKTKTIHKSSETGKIVSPKQAAANPQTTYKTVSKRSAKNSKPAAAKAKAEKPASGQAAQKVVSRSKDRATAPALDLTIDAFYRFERGDESFVGQVVEQAGGRATVAVYRNGRPTDERRVISGNKFTATEVDYIRAYELSFQ